MGRRVVVIALFAAVAGACTRTKESPSPPGSAAVSLAAAAPAAEKPQERTTTTILDFVSGFDNCSLAHRGVLLDLGDATMRARTSSTRQRAPGVEVREREGATWADLTERSIELSFVAPHDTKNDAGVVVEARARGGAARSLALYLNG